MPLAEEKRIKINHEDQHRQGTLYYKVYQANDRTKRAATGLLGSWAAAGVTLFIPIAHFILVPTFLIAGPVLAVVRYRQESSMESVKGECPKCEQSIELALEANDKLPKWTYCPNCGASIQVTD